MKIAFIHQPFDYITPNIQSSSIGIWTDRVIKTLETQGVEFVIYSKYFENLPTFEQHGSVLHRRFSTRIDEWTAKPAKLLERALNYPWKHKPYFASDLSYGIYARQIAEDIQNEKPDIVHIQNYSQFVPVVRALNPDVKIVLHMHCEWLTQIDPAIIAPRVAKTDLIAGCSDFITGTIQSAFPELQGKTTSFYNGVDEVLFAAPSDAGTRENGTQKRLLFVGRVSPEKGIHTKIEAFKIIAKHLPDVQLDIVGAPGDVPYEYIVLISRDPKVNALKNYYQGMAKRGVYYEQIQALIPAELSSRINFLGYATHNDLVKHYQNADVLVNTSLSESFGMSLIEAMACQVPVVATRVGGMVDIVVEGDTGLLVDANNPQQLAEAAIKLLTDDALASRMGQAGRQRVEECFTWKKVTEQVCNQYQLLLRKAG
jgi:spore coat protein SA